MYHWTILHKPDTHLVKSVHKVQTEMFHSSDWICQVRQDLDNLKIELSDEEIADMSKSCFRKLVDSRIRTKCTSYLQELINKHKKTKNLVPGGPFKEYLRSEKLTTKQKQLLFCLRVGSVDTKSNMKSQFKDKMGCRYCLSSELEDYGHLRRCSSIITSHELKAESDQVHESHIFSDFQCQIRAVKFYEKVFNKIQIIKTRGAQA